jgi:CRP/FNR family transcriptional regulator, cyclic AMP receptor protein
VRARSPFTARLPAVADARIARLRSVPLFSACSDKELAFIASRADEVDLPAGKVLTEKGKSGGDFFVILEGKADVEADKGRRTLGPGDFFGEIALIDNGPRTATVKTATPMRCLVLGHSQFRDVLHQNGEIAVKILKAVTERLRAATSLATG